MIKIKTVIIFTLFFYASVYAQYFKLNIKHLDSLKKLINTDLSPSKKCDLYNQMAAEYFKVYNLDSIRFFADKAVKASKADDYREGEGKAYRYLAWAARISYDKREYFFLVNKAIDLLKESSNKKDLAEAYGLLGRFHVRYIPRDTALVYYNKQLNIASGLNDSLLIASAFSDLGQYYNLKGDQKKADHLFKKALAVFESRKDTAQLVSVLGRYSYVKDSLRIHPESIELLKRCISLVKDGDNFYLISDVYFDYAYTLSLNNQINEAIRNYNISLEYAAKCKSDYLSMLGCIDLAAMYRKLNDFKVALKYQMLAFSYNQKYLSKLDYDAVNLQKSFLNMERSSYDLKLKQKGTEYKNKMIMVFAFVLCAILLFALIILRQKAKSNKLLAEKNKLINVQNEKLEDLNLELERRVESRTNELNKTNIELRHEIALRYDAEEAVKKINIDLERRVKDRTHKLELANKELESFSYSVSHDLRAPLRSIDGFSRVLLDEYSIRLDDAGKNLLNRIIHSTEKMSHLIESLLSLSKIARKNIVKSHVCLSHIALEIADELKNSYKGTEIKFIIADGIYAECDSNFISIVLENLLDNAVKYSMKKESPVIEFGLITKETGPVYFVKDNGVGYDMNYAEKLFEPFQRIHSEEEYQGTGIGLATVKRIIAKHGGAIWSESELEKGSIFYFTI